MNKPDISKYGYVSSNSFEEESGWTIEGGEEAYYKALNKYNNKQRLQRNRCSPCEVPKNLIKCSNKTK